jgi:hypothetical protein
MSPCLISALNLPYSYRLKKLRESSHCILLMLLALVTMWLTRCPVKLPLDSGLLPVPQHLRLSIPVSTCSGYGYSLVVRALLEVIEEIEVEGRVILVAGIGCHTIRLFGAKLDMTTGAHGLAPAIATGLKHAPYNDAIIITVRGDGDCVVIGPVI